MKTVYPKTKGKVHPSPSSSLPHLSSPDAFSVLSVLPAAILALASALVVEDREVLAYLIFRSLSSEERRRCCRSSGQNLHHQQRPPAFDCGCFDCYTSFWIRWDASPNRDLIHAVIDAFEDHLAASEIRPSRRTLGRRISGQNRPFWSPASPDSDEVPCSEDALPTPEGENQSQFLLAEETGEEPDQSAENEEDNAGGRVGDGPGDAVPGMGRRSLVRKLIPDVMGFFASRLWTV